MYDLVIHDGTLVTSTGLYRADVGIQDGQIASLAPHLSGREQISASGMLVLPGGVDPHVHLEMPVAVTATSDTWETGSRAAAFGGTTTVIDFVEPSYRGQPLLEAFHARLSQAQGNSSIDFSFHMTLCAADDATLQQIPGIIEAGMPSFKIYTTYTGFRLADEELLAAFQAIRQAGGMALVHSESDAIIQNATRRLQMTGRLSVKDFPDSRPAIAETEAVERVLSLAAFAEAPVYIVHVSTRGGAAAIARAHQAGQKAWGETCPQYLLLDDSHIKTEDFDGAKYVCCPPLRSPADNRALWAALQDGSLQTVGTDHCAFNFQDQKELGRHSFLEIPPGLPGIELRLALMYTYGVKAGRITLPQWVELCCTAPARIFGLHPRKGDLVPGADADIVLFDPEQRASITRSLLHENVDYTPYEGMKLAGMVRTTILRGQVLVRDGQWVAENRTGNYLAC
ncbi:MAG: dihydropyrimidinase [Anaerolineaceae bacterium]|nr:dihydropyrimidinase [Anaerolineaceae bacterium]